MKSLNKLTLWCCIWLSCIAYSSQPLAISKLRASTLRVPVGTGSLFKAKSGKFYLLTVWHVCLHLGDPDERVSGSLPDGTTFLGKIVKTNPTSDLCAIDVTYDVKLNQTPTLVLANKFPFKGKLYTRGYPELVLTEAEGHYTGELKMDAGFPIEDLGECPKGFKVNRTVYSRIISCTAPFKQYETTLYVRHGSSGSPVVDDNGDLVGVVDTMDEKGSCGIVPFPLLKDFVSDL